MNPQQPSGPPPPPPPTTNPYEFITSATKPPKTRGIGGVSNNSFVMKLVVIIGAAVILMVILALVVNVLFGNKTDLSNIVELTATQQEIARVAQQSTQATDQNINNAAISTRLSVLTEQQSMFTFLGTYGRKVSPAELLLKKDTKTDLRLKQAQATSTYDTVFTQVMRQDLQNYAAALKKSYNNSVNTKEKALLAADYTQVQLLLAQWPSS